MLIITTSALLTLLGHIVVMRGLVVSTRLQCIAKLFLTKTALPLNDDEPEVAHFMVMADESEKHLGFQRLLNRENFNHNIDVTGSGSGELIYARRCLKRPRSACDYLPCRHCLPMFLSHDLYRHMQSCPFNTEHSEVRSKDAAFEHVSCWTVRKELGMCRQKKTFHVKLSALCAMMR